MANHFLLLNVDLFLTLSPVRI